MLNIQKKDIQTPFTSQHSNNLIEAVKKDMMLSNLREEMTINRAK